MGAPITAIESTAANIIMETPRESTVTTVQLPLTSRGRAPSHSDLRAIDKDYFSSSKKYGPRSKDAAYRAESRAVKNMVDAVLDDSNVLEQQVYALH